MNPSIIPSDSGIYKITNTINGHLYVGSAVNLRNRHNQHFNGLKRKDHGNPHLQAAFNKYGESAFVFTVIEIVEHKENLIAREQFFIDALNPEYNIHRIANSALGVRRTRETRDKLSRVTKLTWESGTHRKRMSEAAKRRAARGISKETSAKLSASSKAMWETRDRAIPAEMRERISDTLRGHAPSNKGKRMSEEQLAKLKGRKTSAETRRKMSEAARKRKASPETRANMRKAQIERNRINKSVISEEARRKSIEAIKGKPSPQRGMKRSKETRRKMSEAAKGRVPYNKGKTTSEETRAKQSIAAKNRKAREKAAKEQERLAKEQALLARWENTEPLEPIDPTSYVPLTLWDTIDQTS